MEVPLNDYPRFCALGRGVAHGRRSSLSAPPVALRRGAPMAPQGGFHGRSSYATSFHIF